VIIPVQNVKNLLLNADVVEAVRAERFHVWAVSTIDEGIEILTGFPAGKRQEDGSWPDGTVNFRIDRRLQAMAEAARRFAKEEDGPPSRSE